MGYDFGDDYQNSYNTRKGGGAKKGALDFKGKEVVFYKSKEGFNNIDIVPFKIKSQMHPMVKEGKKKVGDYVYKLDIFVHNKIGPDEHSVVCPKKTYGKTCPICDVADQYYKDGKKDEFTATKAKRICYYNVIDADAPDEGLKIFNSSHFLFEKELIDEALNSNKDGTFIDFAHPTKGYTVEFRGVPATLGKTTYTEFKGFKFNKREASLEKYIDKAVSFDEFITVLSADQLEAIMNGAEEEAIDERVAIQEEPEPDWVKAEEPKKEEPKTENPCPYDHEWGKDNDATPDCEKCRAKNMKVWKECFKAQ